MLSAPPSALKSMVSTSLRSIVDVRDVAEEQGTAAVGRDVDVLGDVGAVEQHRVDAVAALDDVVAVARVPLEDVVAGADLGDVVAAVAVDEIVAVAADQMSAPPPPRMVSLPAPPSRVSFIDAGREGRRGDDVVAAEAVDDESVVGASAR